MQRKDAYFRSNAYQFFKRQGEAVNDCVDQKYRVREQTTRSGFYLATHTALYESIMDGFVQIYGNAKPLFLFDGQKKDLDDLALRAQFFLNRVWENMGQENTGGTCQWLALARDVPLYSMAVGYTRWRRELGYINMPVKTPGANFDMLRWEDRYDVLFNEPEIERIHPYNWFGDWRCHIPAWEGIVRKWTLQDAQGLVEKDAENPEYNQQAVQQLINDLKSGKVEQDSDYWSSNDRSNPVDTDTGGHTQDVVEYWGCLNHAKGMENDPREYQVICDRKRIYRQRVNNIPGFRKIKRVTSSGLNDSPFGRSLLAPMLPHTKIMNLMLNLGIDDTVTRMHNGWAVWDEFLQNPDEFVNPEGTDPIVYMDHGAPKDKIPVRIGGEASGILRDTMQIYQFINQDKQRTGPSDTGLGAAKPTGKETATASRLFAQADTKRERAAITYMGLYGLIPIAKNVNYLALQNTPPIERRKISYDGQDFAITNDDIIEIWNNNLFGIHDSILDPQENQSLKLVNFLTLSRDVLMQDPAGLPKLLNIIRDAGRKSGIRNIDRYFPESTPPQVTTPQPEGQPGSPLSSPLPGQPPAAVPAPGQMNEAARQLQGEGV